MVKVCPDVGSSDTLEDVEGGHPPISFGMSVHLFFLLLPMAGRAGSGGRGGIGIPRAISRANTATKRANKAISKAASPSRAPNKAPRRPAKAPSPLLQQQLLAASPEVNTAAITLLQLENNAKLVMEVTFVSFVTVELLFVWR